MSSSSSAKCLASGNMPSSSTSSSKSRGVLCKVCGDEASGFHYGVDSCEGCKGFFRRCLTQGMNHKCAVDERCEITPFSRNSCQFCRLKKCFQVGMSREASRLGRRPKRLKEMNPGTTETPHRPEKKSFPSLNNLFPFHLPFPQIAFNMADLQTFMRNLNTPMGIIASHQTAILPPPPPPPPPPLLSSFYHLENVNMSFFPNSGVAFSTPDSYAELAEMGNFGRSGKSEMIESATLLEEGIPLNVPDLLKAPMLAPTAAGQSIAFSSPLRCFINGNINNIINSNNSSSSNSSSNNNMISSGVTNGFHSRPHELNGNLFLSTTTTATATTTSKKYEKIAPSPHVFSPVIVAGGCANKKFKADRSAFVAKSSDQRHDESTSTTTMGNHHSPPQKTPSFPSFSVDFLKCSSNMDESKDSNSDEDNQFYSTSSLVSEDQKRPGHNHINSHNNHGNDNNYNFFVGSQSSTTFSRCPPLDWRHRTPSSHHHHHQPGRNLRPSASANLTPCDRTTDGFLGEDETGEEEREEEEEEEEEECTCPEASKMEPACVVIKRSPHNRSLSSSEGSELVKARRKRSNMVPVILRIDEPTLAYDSGQDSCGGVGIAPIFSNSVSSTEFNSSANKKSLMELPPSEDGRAMEDSPPLERSENDSEQSDKDRREGTSFAGIEFQAGKEKTHACADTKPEEPFQEGSENVAFLEKNLKIGEGEGEGEWATLSGNMRRQLFVARNSEVSSDRSDLINLVESSLINAHLQTCIYTAAKVKEGIKRYEDLRRNGLDGFTELQMNEPIKWWEQFVNNMVPVIKRIVMFSKKLPGFSELNQEDQIVLIKQGSFEVILTRYTLLFSEAGMFLPDMSVLVPRERFNQMPLGDFFEEQCKFANDFNKLRLDDYETGILSGIMIMNPERDGLENVRAVQKLQVLYMQALYTYMKRNRPDDYDQHFVQAICSLPKLSRINNLHSKKMQSMKMLCSNGIKMPDLHKEMFHY